MRSVGEHELKDSFLKSDFDYIALGHFHGQAQLSRNAWYSGSVEYFNFGEAQDKKGMLLVDLETGRAESVPVKPKYMIDHPAIDCSGMRSEEIANACWSYAMKMRSETGWCASLLKTSTGPLTGA